VACALGLMMVTAGCGGGPTGNLDAGPSGDLSDLLGPGVVPQRVAPEVPPRTTARVVEVVAGLDHACARLALGRVLCWGRNSRGQLGDGTRIDRGSPTDTGIHDAVALAAGPDSTCAVHTTGEVSCWGEMREDVGNAVDGSAYRDALQRDWLSPRSIGVHDATDVSMSLGAHWSNGHLCTLSRMGEVACMDDPACQPSSDVECYGEAVGRVGGGLVGRRVAMMPGAVEIAGSDTEGCARKASGEVECWGAAPGVVAGVDAVAIVPGCALTAEGEVYCWNVPTHAARVDGLTDVVGLAHLLAGETCALRADAPPLCGDDLTTSAPTELASAGAVVALAGSGTRGREFTCGLDAEGALGCSGADAFGELGIGYPGVHAEASRVVGVEDAIQVALSDTQSCARLATGRVVCWGGYFDGEGLNSILPTEDATFVVAGGENGACALSPSLGLYCWGRNAIADSSVADRGQSLALDPSIELASVSLGGDIWTDPYWVWAAATDVDGHVLRPDSLLGLSTDDRWPQPVTTVGELGNLDLECGLQTNDRVLCRTPYTDRPPTPGELPLDHVRSLGVGHAAVCMALESGEVVCAGDDSLGALGLDSFDNENWDALAPVVGIADAVQVATTAHYGCAVRASGAVACWGFSETGATGRPSAGAYPRARDVVDVSDAVEVAVAAWHACARLGDGGVACWGWEGNSIGTGRLGRGRPRRFATPQRVRF